MYSYAVFLDVEQYFEEEKIDSDKYGTRVGTRLMLVELVHVTYVCRRLRTLDFGPAACIF